jgi:hypothetical protein
MHQLDADDGYHRTSDVLHSTRQPQTKFYSRGERPRLAFDPHDQARERPDRNSIRRGRCAVGKVGIHLGDRSSRIPRTALSFAAGCAISVITRSILLVAYFDILFKPPAYRSVERAGNECTVPYSCNTTSSVDEHAGTRRGARSLLDQGADKDLVPVAQDVDPKFIQ